jgi:hypothetical protein
MIPPPSPLHIINTRYIESYHSVFEIIQHNLEETLLVIHMVPIMVCDALLAHCARFVHPITSPRILPCNEAVRATSNLIHTLTDTHADYASIRKINKQINDTKVSVDFPNYNDRQASMLQIRHDYFTCT